jgi:hypothetical protein
VQAVVSAVEREDVGVAVLVEQQPTTPISRYVAPTAMLIRRAISVPREAP